VGLVETIGLGDKCSPRRPNVSSGYEIGGGGMAASTGERLLGFAIGLERLEARLVARNGPEDAVVVALRGELAKAGETLALIGLLRRPGVSNATIKQFLQGALVDLAGIQATPRNIPLHRSSVRSGADAYLPWLKAVGFRHGKSCDPA
jgi:hypothetical protein